MNYRPRITGIRRPLLAGDWVIFVEDLRGCTDGRVEAHRIMTTDEHYVYIMMSNDQLEWLRPILHVEVNQRLRLVEDIRVYVI